MFLLAKLHLVPASLLVFLAIAPFLSQALDLPWPLNIPGMMHHRRRDDTLGNESAIHQEMITEKVAVGVRKMSGDEGEMFFPDYWNFEAGTGDSSELKLDKRKPTLRSANRLVDTEVSGACANFSILQPLQAPFALHTFEHLKGQTLRARLIKSPREFFSLDQRDFQCPGNTVVCNSINRPNSCCPTGSTCQLITNSGSGDVGCCGEGQTCGGNVSGCPAGDTTCPNAAGGGCCVSGYRCSGVGCIVSSTIVTTVQPVVTFYPPSSSTTSSSGVANAPFVPAVTNTDATTSTSTITAVTSVTSTTTASSFHVTTSSTPSSTTPKSTTTTSATAVLPLRPTSSTVPTTTTTAPPTTITASQCPTGFYQCSAYDHAGCCRVGRDCGLTSCPAQSSTLAINSNGVTVSVIPSGTGDAALGASACALGWFSCASGQGGGCCPSGYACGTSCTATGVVVQGGSTGTAQVAKNNRAGTIEIGLWILMGSSGLAILLLSC